MSALALYTLVHVLISIVALFAGLVVLAGLLQARRLDGWTSIFLATTIATSVTGYGFPSTQLLPSHIVGGISLVVLALALIARYRRRLEGGWRLTYVVTASLALYLNAFVAVVQAFLKVPALHAAAPTQTELPFVITQTGVLALFVGLTIAASVRFRPATSSRAAAAAVRV